MGSPLGRHRPALHIEIDRIVPDGKDARQFMGDDDDRRPEAVPQFKDQVIQQAGAHRIESSRRLIEKEDVRIEGHGPGQARPAFACPPLISEG